MNLFTDVESLRQTLSTVKKSKSIAFVPTMGALHDGHLALVDYAKKHCDYVIVSIFVNPTQFGPNEDFSTYPRTLENDSKKLELLGVDALFCPSQEVIYPEKDPLVTVSIPKWQTRYCGKTRPMFFQGVCAVVLRLFNIITPNIAIFGQKDFQQYKIIQQLTKELFLPISIIGLPTKREENGLALSSRNTYLNNTERIQASTIYSSLNYAKNQFYNNQLSTSSQLTDLIKNHIHTSISIDYCVVIDSESLDEIQVLQAGQRILFAGYLGKTRLIDNIEL